jgi:cell wall-associated NlpC family hydrolase
VTSTVQDEKEIADWNKFAADMGDELDHHEIRSHRAPLVREFSLFRLVAFTVAMGLVAAFAVAESLPERAQPARASAPQNLAEPSDVPTVELAEPILDSFPVAPREGKTEPVKKQPAVTPPSGIDIVISFALAQQGKRYSWAKAGPNSYDCSGLVLAAFKQIGIKLPHYTGTMIRHGKSVSRAQLQREDVVFPASGHVGIYLGNGMMVHASSSKGRVVVAKVYSFHAARRLL